MGPDFGHRSHFQAVSAVILLGCSSTDPIQISSLPRNCPIAKRGGTSHVTNLVVLILPEAQDSTRSRYAIQSLPREAQPLFRGILFPESIVSKNQCEWQAATQAFPVSSTQHDLRQDLCRRSSHPMALHQDDSADIISAMRSAAGNAFPEPRLQTS